MKRPSTTTWIWLAWLALGTVVVAIAAAYDTPLRRHGDSNSFLGCAVGLRTGQGFVSGLGPETFRTPGYPLLVAAVQTVTGLGWRWALLLLQLGLLGHLGALTAQLARSLWPERPGRADLALAIVLFSPTLWLVATASLSDMPFAWLLALALRGLWHARTTGSGRSALLAALTLTAATFVRPIGLPLPLVLLPLAMVRATAGVRLALAAGLVIHLASVGAWAQRNAAWTGTPTFASVQEVNLDSYVAAAIEARTQGRPWDAVRREFEREVEALPPTERTALRRRRGLATVAAHPLVAAEVWGRGVTAVVGQSSLGHLASLIGLRQSNSGIIYRFVSQPFDSFVVHMFEHEAALLLLLLPGSLALLALWALALRGAVRLWRERRAVSVGLGATIAVLLVLSGGPQSNDRFRVPLVAPLALLAARGLGRQREGEADDSGSQGRPAPAATTSASIGATASATPIAGPMARSCSATAIGVDHSAV